MTETSHDAQHSTSTGFTQSEVGWLDIHFEVCRPEYEAQLRAVGIQPGWHVLDAACGGGSYLPRLAELVGPQGRIAALDLTPENVAVVERRVVEWAFPCLVEAQIGDVTVLPYPDDHFDAVWFANAAQYLDDDRLRVALAEFRRVVRPGGLVAVKDSTGFDVCHPLPPLLLRRMWEAGIRSDGAMGQIMRRLIGRTPLLRRWLEETALEDVWQRRTSIERWAPFTPAEHQYLLDIVADCVSAATRLGVSAADREAWARVSDPETPVHPANTPDGYYHEGNVLAVGRVPERE